MTPQTAVELEFADGDYLFDLKLPQLAELQELRGAGIFVIYGRVVKGRYLVDDGVLGLPHDGEAYAEDMLETIRLALIGGGGGMVNGMEVKVDQRRARTLVERYCHNAPLREVWNLAAAILTARVEGYTPPGGEAPAKPATPTDPSISPTLSTTAASSEPIGES